MHRVLGIDPALRRTGFGIIHISNTKVCYETSGVIMTDSSQDLPQRLLTLSQGLKELLLDYQPSCVAVEKVFTNLNPQSTLLLSHARGALLASAAGFTDRIFEYSALQIKQSVAGYGHASKLQLAEMVKHTLNLKGKISLDASDALAIALTHCYASKILR